MLFDLSDEAADPAEQRTLRSTAAFSADSAAVPLVLTRFEPDTYRFRIERYMDLAVPGEIMVLKARSAIDLKWSAFVVDPEEILAIDRQEASKNDFVLAREMPDQWLDLSCDSPTLRLPQMPDAAASNDPRSSCRERCRIHVQQVMSVP